MTGTAAIRRGSPPIAGSRRNQSWPWTCLPGRWTRTCINGARDPDAEYWLLARSSPTDPTDSAYYLTHGPKRVALAGLARAAGARWAIEESFQTSTGQTSTGQTGLDHYQVRQYTGWYRHITLSMLAHAFLTVTRSKKGTFIQQAATSPP